MPFSLHQAACPDDRQVEAALSDQGSWLSPFQPAGKATQEGFGSSTGCAHAQVPKHPTLRTHTSVVTWSLIQASIQTKAGHVGAPLGMLTALYLAGTRRTHTPGAPCLPSQGKPNMDPSSRYLHQPGHLGAITSSKSSPPQDELTGMHSCHHRLQRANFS